MNKPIVITIAICLGIPFLLSFRSSRPRTFRRKALLVGFSVMIFMVPKLPYTEFSYAAEYRNGNSGVVSSSSSTGEGTEGPVSASLCAAEEVDFSGYSAVGCAEVSATNFLKTAKGSVYPAENAFDGNTATCWQDGVDGNGEGTELYAKLSESCDLQYIVIYNGQVSDEERFRKNGRVCQLEIGNGQFTETLDLPDENIPLAIKLNGWENTSDVYFKINSVYPGSEYSDTCISEIIFYR